LLSGSPTDSVSSFLEHAAPTLASTIKDDGDDGTAGRLVDILPSTERTLVTKKGVEGAEPNSVQLLTLLFTGD
jgi:hypothetical protein